MTRPVGSGGATCPIDRHQGGHMPRTPAAHRSAGCPSAMAVPGGVAAVSLVTNVYTDRSKTTVTPGGHPI